MTVKDIPEDGKCYKCNKPLDGDYFCFGCKAFICEPGDEDGCEPSGWSMADATIGGHDPEDHWEEAVDDDAAEW